MWLQEPFPPRHQAGGMYPTLIKWRMLAFACPAAIQGKSSHPKILPPVNFAWQWQSPQKHSAKLLFLLQQLARVYCWAAASPCSKASFCSSSVFLVNPAEGPYSSSKALTSPGSDNPPKGDGCDFKALKSQSAGLNLPNSVPDGIKPSWAKLGS